MNFLKQIIALLFIVGVGYVLYDVAVSSRDSGFLTLKLNSDNTTTFAGTVLSNNNSCSTPGGSPDCSLKVQVGQDTVFVLYAYSDAKFCANEVTAMSGKNISSGKKVQVYGLFEKKGLTNTILTCPSTNFYIKTI